jgi:hypothetical protein
MKRKDYLQKAGIKLNKLEFRNNLFDSSIIIDFGTTEVCEEIIDSVMFCNNLNEYLNTDVTDEYIKVIAVILGYKEIYKNI